MAIGDLVLGLGQKRSSDSRTTMEATVLRYWPRCGRPFQVRWHVSMELGLPTSG